MVSAAGQLQLERLRVHERPLDEVEAAADAAELVALYGEQVPVVTVDGKVRFRGGVNRVLLQRLLEAETGNE